MGRRSQLRGLIAIGLLIGALGADRNNVLAQTTAPEAAGDGAFTAVPSDLGSMGDSPTSAITGTAAAVDPAAVAAIARDLNCPLCQGYSLLDCPLQVCGQMRQLIADRLAAGWTPEKVRAQFVTDYGPQILSAPPTRGWGLIAWLAPLVAALAGVGLLWLRRRTAPSVAAGVQGDPSVAAGVGADAASPSPSDAAETDRRRRLEALAREDA